MYGNQVHSPSVTDQQQLSKDPRDRNDRVSQYVSRGDDLPGGYFPPTAAKRDFGGP